MTRSRAHPPGPARSLSLSNAGLVLARAAELRLSTDGIGSNEPISDTQVAWTTDQYGLRFGSASGLGVGSAILLSRLRSVWWKGSSRPRICSTVSSS